MIKRIILENYMSHTRTEIEPGAGLTVLLGPNNCGKSAVVSAIETLARNIAGDFMIRHGEKEARVTIHTDDGHELVWRRKGATVAYRIDGRDVNRPRRDVPDDLHDHLKLPKVRCPDGDEFEVHIAQQKDPIFLLNDAESRPAMFFSASSDAGRLLELQDRHRSKTRERKIRRESLAGEIKRIDRDLEKLAPIDEVAPLLEAAQKEFAEAQKRDAEADELRRTIEHILKTDELAQGCKRKATQLAGLSAPPALEDAAPLVGLIDAIGERSRAIAGARAEGDALRALREPPAPEDVAPLRRLIESMEQSQRAKRGAAARSAATSALRESPELADAAPLVQAINELDSASKKLFVCAQTVSNLDRQIADARRKIDLWAIDNPNCPICGSPIRSGSLLEEGAHAHGRSSE